MLRRTPFKKTLRVRPPRPPLALAPPGTLPNAVMWQNVGEVVAVPKGTKSRPGKRAPTVEESRWIAACMEFGCWACHVDYESTDPRIGHHPGNQYHHIVESCRRLGHRYGYCLCPAHHQPDSRSGKVSIHPGRRPEFLARYGKELEILHALEDLLGFGHAP